MVVAVSLGFGLHVYGMLCRAMIKLQSAVPQQYIVHVNMPSWLLHRGKGTCYVRLAAKPESAPYMHVLVCISSKLWQFISDSGRLIAFSSAHDGA